MTKSEKKSAANSQTKAATDKLEGAYALDSPNDNRAYYRDFAATYAKDFVVDTGYVVPREVGRAFLAHSGPEDTPVLDIGAGTGLLAQSLGGIETDGIDISDEMLAKAAAKGLYRNLIVADLTGKLDIADARYGALVSSGTFTHGHVGPGALAELLRIARPGALFCLGINLAIFDSAGFGSAFARLVADARITPLDFREIAFYEGVEHKHSTDHGVAALFRKR